MIDDLGWRDLHCTGSDFYETPNLDRLASQGIRFTNAYAACPVCSPTRASLMSGKYPARVGVTNFIGGHARGKLLEVPYTDHLPLEEICVARPLKEAGYATWHVGKWHLGEPPYYPDRHGFDVNVGGGKWGMPPKGYFSPWGIATLPEREPGVYLTDQLTDEALRLIRSADRPFFLNFCHYAVHVPIQAPEPLVAKYRDKAKALGLDHKKTFEQGDYFPCEHKKDQRISRRLLQSDPVYAGMIESLDANVGRILTALEETGQAENTLVLFTSDNGGLATAEGAPTCNSPLSEGKGWMYEGGVREVLLARWPGHIEPGTECDCPVISPDVYPTLLQAAGLPLMPKQHRDGLSLKPLLEGGRSLDRDAIFWHYPHYGNQGGTPAAAMRMGDWKLIEFFEGERFELYDLAEDPGEHRDLAREDPERVQRMRRRLTDWMEDVQAKRPTPNPDYVPPSRA